MFARRPRPLITASWNAVLQLRVSPLLPCRLCFPLFAPGKLLGALGGYGASLSKRFVVSMSWVMRTASAWSWQPYPPCPAQPCSFLPRLPRRYMVEQAAPLGVEIIDRCNLTVLLEPGQEDLVGFLATHKAGGSNTLQTRQRQ